MTRSVISHVVSLGVMSAAISCGGAETSDPIAESEMAIRPSPGIATTATISVTPGTQDANGDWLVPADQDRVVTCHVVDALGNFPSSGTVIFDFCIDQRTHLVVPKENCQTHGSAKWGGGVSPPYVPATGNASFTMGHDDTLTRGTRCRYSGNRNGWASATSDPTSIIPTTPG